MSLSKWVTPIKDHVVYEGNVIKSGTPGFIHQVEDDGRIYVCFPQAHVHFKLSELRPAPKLTVEEALEIIKEHQGHHCDEGQFQFNIKFYCWDFPPEVEAFKQKSSRNAELVYNEYYSILEQELCCLVGAEADYGYMQLFDWIETWHTAGRSGGWLVLTHHRKIWHEDYRADIEELRHRIANYDEESETEDLWVLEDQLAELEDEVVALAMDLQYIDIDIERAKESLEEYIATNEPWEGFIDWHLNTDEEETDVEEEDDKESGHYYGTKFPVGVGA